MSDRQAILADAALMQAVAAGDHRAFERLMRAESPRLVRLATSLLGSVAEAEEIAQEAFLRLWRTAPSWQPIARVGTWLHRVVYRLSIDRLRQRRPTVDVEDMESVLAGPDASPEEALGARQREQSVEEALERLSPRQRSAILLAHVEGLSQMEAASVLDVSEDAYESLLARGRKRLRALVAESERGKDMDDDTR